MKFRFITACFCMFVCGLFYTKAGSAQQANSLATAPGKAQTTVSPGKFDFKVFMAPNKVYGYDIFENGRIVFHQPAAAQSTGDKKTGLLTKPLAEKAAMFAIEKIKKGLSPELSQQDILKIASR